LKRNTNQRQAIMEVFLGHNRPLGTEEILAEGVKIIASLNQATVYRNLKLLLEEGWLVKIQHPTLGALYERNGKRHHHHFHCRVCDRLYDLPGCGLSRNHRTAPGFQTEGHEVFLYGVCAECKG